MFLLAYLNITPLYHVESEPFDAAQDRPEMNRGFADIFLRKNYFTTDKTKHKFLVEMKYVTKEELKQESSVEHYKQLASAQIERYAASQKKTCSLTKIVIIATADKALFVGSHSI